MLSAVFTLTVRTCSGFSSLRTFLLYSLRCWEGVLWYQRWKNFS